MCMNPADDLLGVQRVELPGILERYSKKLEMDQARSGLCRTLCQVRSALSNSL